MRDAIAWVLAGCVLYILNTVVDLAKGAHWTWYAAVFALNAYVFWLVITITLEWKGTIVPEWLRRVNRFRP